MNTPARWLIIVLAIAAAGFGGFWFGRAHPSAETESDPKEAATTEPAGEEKPVVEVTTARVKTGPIEEIITAYGTVVARAGDVRVLSVPFESRVTKLLVAAGEQVAAGAEIVQIEPSPDAKVALQEAQNALAAAERDLKQTQAQFSDHLATNAELSLSQQALQTAKLKLETFTKRGAETTQRLKSEAAGIISKINVQEGQIVPAGAPLAEIIAGNSIEVSLGVEPADASQLKPAQPVELSLVDGNNAPAAKGKIRVISQRVDPATRLASVLVSLPANTRWMLDSYVVGKLTKVSAKGLIVPREALLPEEGGAFALFTVKDEHAIKHVVRVGLENDQFAQVISDEVKDSDEVIVLGHYALEHGTQVTVNHERPASTAPATTEAAK